MQHGRPTIGPFVIREASEKVTASELEAAVAKSQSFPETAPVAGSSVLDFISAESARVKFGLSAGDDDNQQNEADERESGREDEVSTRAPPDTTWESSDGLLSYPPNWYPQIPLTEVQASSEPAKSILTVAFTPKGNRMATGGMDHILRLWDFRGMTQSVKPFREIPVVEGHPIRAVEYSATGGLMAVVVGDPIVRILNGDGQPVQQTVQSYLHIRDTTNTQGHTHGACCTQWSPTDKNQFISGAQDASVRLWDLNAKPYGIDEALPHVQLFKAVNDRKLSIAGRCHVTAVRFFPAAGNAIAGGCSDGSLQLWDLRKRYNKPDQMLHTAHTDEVTSVAVLRDDRTVLSRAQDDTLKLWDVRAFTKPVAVRDGLPNNSTGLALLLTPDESVVLTGVDSTANPNDVAVHAFSLAEGGLSSSEETSSLNPISLGPVRSAIALAMVPALHQLAVGCGSGLVRFFVDSPDGAGPSVSSRSAGAALICSAATAARRAAVKRPGVDSAVNLEIYTMEDLPAGVRHGRDGELRMLKGARLRQHRIEQSGKRIKGSAVGPRPNFPSS